MSEWTTRADGLASELVLRWPGDVGDFVDREVTVTATASLMHLSTTWSFDAGRIPAGGDLLLVVEVPVEAQLDPVVEHYVVDLELVAHIEGATVALDPVWLAWPDGLAAEPVLWTQELGERLAPHGTTDPDALQLAADMGVEGRLMPPIALPTSRPDMGQPLVIDGPVDTALYAVRGAP